MQCIHAPAGDETSSNRIKTRPPKCTAYPTQSGKRPLRPREIENKLISRPKALIHDQSKSRMIEFERSLTLTTGGRLVKNIGWANQNRLWGQKLVKGDKHAWAFLN